EQYLNQKKQAVDRYLDDFLPAVDSDPEIIHEAMRYSVFAGGKRIRPILALATGEALGGDFQKLIYLAGALEMIHTYSLIHDDLPAMDDDDYRRGQLTAHKKFGEGIAILAGNALLTLAFQRLAEIPTRSDEAEIKLAVMHQICRAIGTARGMLAGQVMDLLTQGKPFSSEQLEQIHSSKTGALIQASVYCSALVSGAEEEARKRLGTFGSSVGLAFQIVDDILDVEGSSRELGKTSGKDDLNHKATYPAMYGLQTSRKIAAELVKSAIHEISFLGPRGEVLTELAQFISVRRF
ncbi:polyprenyl synthetase family protein, partial [Acidobacteria bacterium AH-259-G07]|nr:polyprenyl synthetase family protein [Acidobacteria bacterium AH-259-G07]